MTDTVTLDVKGVLARDAMHAETEIALRFYSVPGSLAERVIEWLDDPLPSKRPSARRCSVTEERDVLIARSRTHEGILRHVLYLLTGEYECDGDYGDVVEAAIDAKDAAAKEELALEKGAFCKLEMKYESLRQSDVQRDEELTAMKENRCVGWNTSDDLVLSSPCPNARPHYCEKHQEEDAARAAKAELPPFTCGTCGGSGGGDEPHLVCRTCNGSGAAEGENDG